MEMLKCRRRIQKTAPMRLGRNRMPWIKSAGALVAATATESPLKELWPQVKNWD